jgi:hypothetical protein
MRPIRNLRWYIGGLLFLSTVINHIDRQMLSVLAPSRSSRWAAMLLLVRSTIGTR